MSVPTRGIVPPLVTPLRPDGSADPDAMARLVEWQISAGVSGVLIGGSTGEIAALSDADRTTAIGAAVRTSAGRVPVLAGVIDTGTRRVIDQVRRAAGAGADAVVSTPPFYIVPSDEEILEHYRLVAAASPVPVLAYSIPVATHVAVPPAVVGLLAREGTIVGFKDSAGDLDVLRAAAVEVAGVRGFGLFTGSEATADRALRAGATGIVPGLGNVDPHGYVALQAAADAEEWDAVAAQQDRLARLLGMGAVTGRIAPGFTPGALEAFKAALVLRGVLPSAQTSPPLRQVGADQVARVREFLVEAELSLV